MEMPLKYYSFILMEFFLSTNKSFWFILIPISFAIVYIFIRTEYSVSVFLFHVA